MEHQAQFPGVQIAETSQRRYEQGNIAAQILGYVGEISRGAAEGREEDGYAAGDQIGQTGHRGPLRQLPARHRPGSAASTSTRSGG